MEQSTGRYMLYCLLFVTGHHNLPPSSSEYHCTISDYIWKSNDLMWFCEIKKKKKE